jgi:hypothetical protein
MEVDAENLSSRQFNWFFNYMCYKESKLKALIIKTQNDRSENFKKQESMISKQARLLPDAVNTIIIKKKLSFYVLI